MRRIVLVIHFLIILLAGCRVAYQPVNVQVGGVEVTGLSAVDTGMLVYLKPFRDSMERTMGEVLWVNAQRMDVRRPVSTLGNFMADACLQMAREKFDTAADISVVKLGSIRRPYIDPGPVSRSIVFELMPFDNLMVLVEMKGETLTRFIGELAAEGAGISGFTMRMNNKQAFDVRVGGMPIDSAKTYTLVYSDYNYNNTPVLKEGMLRSVNYMIRDAIEDYVRSLQRRGRDKGESLENRIYVGQ